jgi:hypothetical protein
MAGGMGFLGAALSGFGGGSIGAAVVHLLLDTKGFDTGLAKSEAKLTASSNTMGSKLKALGPTFGLIGAAAVAGIGVAAVRAFEASDKAIAQTNAVLKSTGGIAGVTASEVTKLSKALQSSTTYSDEEVRSAENLLLTFTKISDDIFPETTEAVLNMSTALGQDLKSSSIQLGKALNDPIKGVTSLRRVGVDFNQEAVDTITNLVETNHLLEAQKLILAEVANEFGGSAAAQAKTFSGQMKQLGNQLNNVLEQLGKFIVSIARQLMPVLKALVPILGFAARNADLLLLAFGGFGTVKWIIPFLASMTVKLQAMVGASLTAQVATSKFFITLAAAAGPIGVALAAFGAFVIVMEKVPTRMEDATSRLEALGFTAGEAAERLKPLTAEFEAQGIGSGIAKRRIEDYLVTAERGAEEARGWAKRQQAYAHSLDETRDAARGAGRSISHFTGLVGDKLKDFKSDVRGSTNFVLARWEDLAGQSRVTATQIIRQFRRALRDQREFGEHTREFATKVRRAFGGEIPEAAQQMITDLAARGTEGAAIMAGLADASGGQIRTMLRQWKAGQQGPANYLGILKDLDTKLTGLNGRSVVVDITARYHQVGAPPPGLAGFDQAVEDALSRQLVHHGGRQ